VDHKEPFGGLEGYAASASEAFRTVSQAPQWLTEGQDLVSVLVSLQR
jgi:hypothetical protein